MSTITARSIRRRQERTGQSEPRVLVPLRLHTYCMKDVIEWFWYDETGDEYGPYRTRRRAQRALDEYVAYNLDGLPVPWTVKLRWRVRRWLRMTP